VTSIVRFGGFELDTNSGELSSGWNKVPLQEQPFLILKLLTDRPGEVVTREEIQSRLWPDDTVVEFENAVNAAIKKLRIALGDSAEEPKYIETLRRRGYRLMVAVERVGDLDSAGVGTVAAGRGLDGRWRGMALAGGVLVVAGLGYGYWQRAAPARLKLTDRDSIVLADFTNKTSDAVFNETLRQGLTVQLEQSPFLSLVSEERIQQTLRLMGQPADAPLTAATAWEVCQRTGSAAVVDGSIASLGSEYVVWVRARNCRTGEVMDEEQRQAARKEDVLQVLSEIASRFRSRVGESVAMVGKLDTPLAEATTSSLEALKAYSMGWKVLASSGSEGAVPLFKRATEIDPQFAMAHAMLGRVYGDIAESALAAKSTSKAWQLRSRANERERFFIDASYEIQVTGNLEKAAQTCEAWEQTYPREPIVHGFLAGAVYPSLGKYEAALEESRKMVEVDPDFPVGYNLLALSYEALGRLDEASGALAAAKKRGLEIPDLLVDQYQIAFLRGDHAGMETVVGLAAKKSGAEDVIADQQAFGAAYGGHVQQARGFSDVAVQVAEQAGQRERAAIFQSGAALRDGFFGNAVMAKRSAAVALGLSKARDVEYGAALGFVLAGDAAKAEALADELERRLPEDAAVKFSYAPVLRAQVALSRHDAAKALATLEIARPYELGEPPSCAFGFYGVLYPAYVRGEAYLALHDGAKAAVEFEKILAHRGTVVSDPIGALAHLQAGRAYAMAGDMVKAKAAYVDFLTLWKDGDADVPVLQEARVEAVRVNANANATTRATAGLSTP